MNLQPDPAEIRQDLQALEQRWGLALHSAGFGVWDLDVPGQRVSYSPQWKALLGYPDDDRPDETSVWRARVHADDLPAMAQALGEHLSGSAPSYAHEFRLRAADGSFRWVLSRGRVVQRDAEGRALRAVGTLTDMTDRREAERLRVERDRAEAASQAKSQFLSRMSHELRTPLNAVLGCAQLLGQQLGGADVAAQRRYVSHIETAGWQLLRLVDDVLDLSRLQSGALRLQAETVELSSLLPASLEAVRAQARPLGLRLDAAPAPPGAAVRADGQRLRQVLALLLDNAVRYNRQGGKVSLHVRPAPAGWTLAVADNGRGIAAAQLPHLFEPFNAIGRVGAAAGIGLVLARSLLQAMDGSLALHSVEGVGSTFELTLPAAA